MYLAHTQREGVRLREEERQGGRRREGVRENAVRQTHWQMRGDDEGWRRGMVGGVAGWGADSRNTP